MANTLTEAALCLTCFVRSHYHLSSALEIIIKTCAVPGQTQIRFYVADSTNEGRVGFCGLVMLCKCPEEIHGKKLNVVNYGGCFCYNERMCHPGHHHLSNVWKLLGMPIKSIFYD